MEIKKALNKVSENKTVVLKAVGITVASAAAIVAGIFVAKKAKNNNKTDLSA
jgi:hypothetical protein